MAFSIEQSDARDGRVGQPARLDLRRAWRHAPIAVIPNFLDCAIHRRRPRPDLRKRFTGGDEATKIVVHVSNFRPVKRVDAVVDDLRSHPASRCRRGCCWSATVPTWRWRSDGARARHQCHWCDAVGAQEEVVPLLSIADVFLLPSAQESFGLAALEAMACEVPVVASRVGGLPEVIEHGVSGFLHPLDADRRDGGERGRAADRSCASPRCRAGRLPPRARAVLRRAGRADVRGVLSGIALVVSACKVSVIRLPRAVLLDLDDTILDDSGSVSSCWLDACHAHGPSMNGLDPVQVYDAIERVREWYWADPERHRVGRLDLAAARRDVVQIALAEIGIDNPTLARQIGDTYHDLRDSGLQPFADAIDTVQWLRAGGCRLALLTNGSAQMQRSKITRFGLAEFFDADPHRGRARVRQARFTSV